MDVVNHARSLLRQGRFVDAIGVLNEVKGAAAQTRAAQLMRAHALERLGKHTECLQLLKSLSRSGGLTESDRATSEYIVARVCIEEGEINDAIQHLQRSISLARGAGDLEQLAWSQIRLCRLIGERSAPEAAATLINQARLTTIELGDRQTSAALHIAVGEIEAQRGLLTSGEQHARFGLELLKDEPNLWLESVAENIRFSAGLFRQEFDRVREIGLRALNLAEESGVVGMLRSCLSNLGYLSLITGEFKAAADYLERGLSVMSSSGDRMCAALATLAEVRLYLGSLDESERLFRQVDELMRADATDVNRTHYAARFTSLTRSYLFEEQRQLDDALACTNHALEAANSTGDHYLQKLATLRKCALLVSLQRGDEALAHLRELQPEWSGESPSLYAEYEGVLAMALADGGALTAARQHQQRALRVYSSLKNVLGRRQLERSLSRWPALSVQASEAASEPADTSMSTALESLAHVFALSARPALVAEELCALLKRTELVVHAVVRADLTASLAKTKTTDEQHAPIRRDDGLVEERLRVGEEGDRTISIEVRVRADARSQAILTALAILVSKVRELQIAEREKENRTAIWPVDESEWHEEALVVGAHMRGLLKSIRHVATTNISVLITGESGTGKEVLARAIHAASARSRKPFIPFNCAAVPRDLLESHLFGHRKGAFTGADRDHPGVIRQASGGTLFLDEIGELSPQLQPKLLRFLESGEICPVGESLPFAVSVRVIAATNADLERMVAKKRFREDLFYRLNVVRLSLPPLRERRHEIPGLVHHFLSRAAEEFGRGQMRIAEEAMQQMLLYAWPGNVRQVQNEIRRMVAMASPDSVLTREALSPAIADINRKKASPAPAAQGFSFSIAPDARLGSTVSHIEREMIQRALRHHDGRLEEAARALGISRKGLYLKRQRLGLL